MQIVCKIVLVLGILGAVAAAEGLNRFGGFVSALGGEDTPYYMGMLVVAAVGAVVLLAGLFSKSHFILKWVMFILLIGSAGLMLNVPAFPVNQQIIIGLVIAAIATAFIGTKPKQK